MIPFNWNIHLKIQVRSSTIIKDILSLRLSTFATVRARDKLLRIFKDYITENGDLQESLLRTQMFAVGLCEYMAYISSQAAKISFSVRQKF